MMNLFISLLVATFVGGLLGIIFVGDSHPGSMYGFLTMTAIHFAIWLFKRAWEAVDELFDLG